MKTTYKLVVVLFFCSNLSFAQLTLTKAANEPVLGDIRVLVDFDSSTALPKTTGIGQTWNFSSISTSGGFTETTTFTNVPSTPGASLFPTATLASRRGSDNYEYHKSNGSNWELMGEYDDFNGDHMVLSNTAVFNVWPISLNSSSTDAAVGLETTTSGTTSMNANISYTATGAGTVVLPGGITHNNCLQVISVISLSATSGAGTYSLFQRTYEYYSSTKKFPILSLQYSTISSGAGTQKEYDLLVNQDALVAGLQTQQNTANEIALFPNPASDHVFLKLPENTKVESIELTDMTGRLVFRTCNTDDIDVSQLENACYIANIQTEKGTVHKPLVVNKH